MVNLYSAMVNVRSAMVNVRSAMRNIEQHTVATLLQRLFTPIMTCLAANSLPP